LEPVDKKHSEEGGEEGGMKVYYEEGNKNGLKYFKLEQTVLGRE
jgi:hypothetical protein